jgi:hypothetical protein
VAFGHTGVGGFVAHHGEREFRRLARPATALLVVEHEQRHEHHRTLGHDFTGDGHGGGDRREPALAH